MNAAIQAAERITALLPAQPRKHLTGVRQAVSPEQDDHFYSALMVGAINAWQYAASNALMNAMRVPPRGWITYSDSFETIKNTRNLETLKAMCDPAYQWPGCWADRNHA